MATVHLYERNHAMARIVRGALIQATLCEKATAPVEKIKQAMNIGPDSKLLVFNTEGATDPVNYREILWYGKYPAL